MKILREVAAVVSKGTNANASAMRPTAAMRSVPAVAVARVVRSVSLAQPGGGQGGNPQLG